MKANTATFKPAELIEFANRRGYVGPQDIDLVCQFIDSARLASEAEQKIGRDRRRVALEGGEKKRWQKII